MSPEGANLAGFSLDFTFGSVAWPLLFFVAGSEPDHACSLPSSRQHLDGLRHQPRHGKKEFSLMSEAEELAIGQQADAEIRREMGVYHDQELQRYVFEIGMRLVQQSHRPNRRSPSSTVPRSTRQVPGAADGRCGILPHRKMKSELAGQPTRDRPRHGPPRLAASAGRCAIGLMVLGTVPNRALRRPVVRGLGVLFLKHGRDDEIGPDRLGMEYASAGRTRSAVPRFLSTLRGWSAGRASGVPNWLVSHIPHRRHASRGGAAAGQVGVGVDAEPQRGRLPPAIDGVVRRRQPGVGIVCGQVFVHPTLRVAPEFSEGWEVG